MKKSFSMVELIIAVMIIAILSVLTQFVLINWLITSRDNQRMVDMKGMEYGLKNYYFSNSTYPLPSDSMVTIFASGYGTVSYQGNFGAKNIKDMNIKGAFKDPLTQSYYTYLVNSTQDKYELMMWMETQTNPYYGSIINNAHATSLLGMTPVVSGKALGILIQRATNMPLQSVYSGNFDLTVSHTDYDAYLGSGDIWTGNTISSLLNLVQFAKNGYDAPSICPAGFIPVPGNKDFGQPGFCIAKYEMKQISGTAGYRNTGNARITGVNELCGAASYCRASSSNTTGASTKLDGKIISKPDGLPIVRLNQTTAIQACKAMGSGYHLTTNNERMSIARNIENQAKNWNTGVVGSGGIYRGKNYRGTTVPVSVNKDANSLDCNMGTDLSGNEIISSLVANANSTACSLGNRNKRELFLSNGQSIRDFASNVWEHVNKANTIDGSGFYIGNIAFGTWTGNRQEWTYTEVDSLEKNLYGPSVFTYTSTNGIGKIRYGVGTTANGGNIFLRGGAARDGLGGGIYAMVLNWNAASLDKIVGFRCAY